MLIENEIEVAAPIEDVWNYMLDVQRMSHCMPGAELTEVVNQNTFKGRVLTKLGPVSLTFNGTAQIVERDESARRIVVKATGAEAKGKGQAELTVTSTMQSTGSGTRIKVSQDLTLTGAAAQYGRGMIQDVAGVLMKQFADCIQQDIGRARRGEGPVQGATAPVQGMSVGVQAAKSAAKRFGKRLFGGGG